MKGIWITWEFQRRNIGISNAVDFPLYQFNIQSCRTVRYIKSLIASYMAINSESPRIVVAQNPSILLALFVILYSTIKGYHPVIDAHNSGIYPLESRSRILMKLSKWLQRHASLTIVTNKALENAVKENGGSAFVLPDAIPSIPAKLKRLQLKGEKNLTCICTYNEDEPYQEIIKAANLLPNGVHVYFTGKFKGKIDPRNQHDNVHFTGFIPEHEYWELLYSSDIIIDLTLRENCLVCGAYEAVSLNKPLILSNTDALRNFFSKGCVYTNPNQNDIYKAMIEAIHNIENLQNDMKNMKMEIEVKWKEKISELKSKLSTLDQITL